ncbi:MAG: VOC family protein [Gemmataceae bacterium]|nr:VOC family protein [Gemmataceae bacterium]
MASSVAKKAALTPKRRAAARKATRTPKPRAKMLIDDVTAILLISPNPKKLCEFYRATLGLPLEEEMHNGIPLHYGYSLGDVHFAIHSADGGWPGVPTRNAQSPIVIFSTSDLKAVVERLSARGVKVTGPTDHGFGYVVSFRDPDGNLVSVIEYAPEYW